MSIDSRAVAAHEAAVALAEQLSGQALGDRKTGEGRVGPVEVTKDEHGSVTLKLGSASLSVSTEPSPVHGQAERIETTVKAAVPGRFAEALVGSVTVATGDDSPTELSGSTWSTNSKTGATIEQRPITGSARTAVKALHRAVSQIRSGSKRPSKIKANN